jgi:hypothetical protein
VVSGPRGAERLGNFSAHYRKGAAEMLAADISSPSGAQSEQPVGKGPEYSWPRHGLSKGSPFKRYPFNHFKGLSPELAGEGDKS